GYTRRIRHTIKEAAPGDKADVNSRPDAPPIRSRWGTGRLSTMPRRQSLAAIVATLVLAAAPALAADDARDTITRQIQELNDAVSNGSASVWEKYLDAHALYVEEDGAVHNKAELVKEITPLPPGLSGNIKVEVLQFHQDGDVATVVFRDHETESY